MGLVGQQVTTLSDMICKDQRNSRKDDCATLKSTVAQAKQLFQARARGLIAARRLKEERNPPGGLTCGAWAALRPNHPKSL